MSLTSRPAGRERPGSGTGREGPLRAVAGERRRARNGREDASRRGGDGRAARGSGPRPRSSVCRGRAGVSAAEPRFASRSRRRRCARCAGLSRTLRLHRVSRPCCSSALDVAAASTCRAEFQAQRPWRPVGRTPAGAARCRGRGPHAQAGRRPAAAPVRGPCHRKRLSLHRGSQPAARRGGLLVRRATPAPRPGGARWIPARLCSCVKQRARRPRSPAESRGWRVWGRGGGRGAQSPAGFPAIRQHRVMGTEPSRARGSGRGFAFC